MTRRRKKRKKAAGKGMTIATIHGGSRREACAVSQSQKRHHMRSLYGLKDSGLIVPERMAEVIDQSQADIVLDPFSGGGTTAAAAVQLGRRFVAVDSQPESAVLTARRALALSKKHSPPISVYCLTRDLEWAFWRQLRAHEKLAPGLCPQIPFDPDPKTDWERARALTQIDWTDGRNRIVLGDNVLALDAMPDSFVDLCYADPPYFKQKTFRGKFGGFEDRWPDENADKNWDYVKKITSPKGAVRKYLKMQRRLDPALGAYLAYCTIVGAHIHRVLKDTGSMYWHTEPSVSYHFRVLFG